MLICRRWSCSLRFRSIRWFRQEYIPSDVDEAEFEVNITAPQGTSLAAMDEIMRAVESELRAVPLVRLMLCDAGGGFISGVRLGRMLRAHRAPRRATFSRLAGSGTRRSTADPGLAFEQHFAARHDAAGSRPLEQIH